MSIIKFTRMERAGGIVRKYGDFWFVAGKATMAVNGHYSIKPAMHGDKEAEVMAEECAACAIDAGFVDGAAAGISLGPWLKRGAGTHPKAGPFIAYKAPGLVVKVTGAGTEIECAPCPVPGARAAAELTNMFWSLIGDRDEVRNAWSRMKKGITE